uniref:G_PROTEIN_RECEP_F1_2 domain-containing protein n=3 Tax=Schistosoma mansoni TaxID=6183 RepID=A0A5K4FBA1_SCHMA
MKLATLVAGYKIQHNKDIITYIVIILLLCCHTNTDNSINTTNNNEYQEKTFPNSTLLLSLNESDQFNNNKSDDCTISLTEFIIYFYIQPIICFIGFILNILNVIIFCRPQFSGAAYAYMIAMSLADAITLISYMPSGLVRCGKYFVYCQHPAFRRFRIYLLYYNAYILFPIGNISETASVWFTLVLSVERYLTMSQIGSVCQNKFRMQPSNTSLLKQKSEILYNTNHSMYSIEYQETSDVDRKLPRNDSIGAAEESIMEQEQHREQQTTVNNLKWYKKLSNCCNLSVLKQHARNSLTNIPTPKSLCILHKLHHSHLHRPIGRCSLNTCIQMYACRNCNFKHSLAFITFFSILLNLPLFFVQKVVRKNIPIKKSTMKPIHNNKTSEWLHTTLNHFNNLTSTDNQYNQGQMQVFTGLTEFGNSDIYKIFSWTRIMLIQVLPLLFLCSVNFCLLRFIHIANKRRQRYLLPNVSNKKPGRFQLHKANLRTTKVNKASSARWQAAQRKLTILLIVIICLFIAGQIPQAFAYITIFEAFNKHFGNVCKRWRCCPPYLIYRSIAHMLGLFTYSINFFVYLTLNKHFKQQLSIWFLLLCPISKQLQRKYSLKQNKLINHSYNPSKSELSFTNQHKSNIIPHNNNLYYRMCKRRRSSGLFYNPTKRLISIDNTDLSSEAVSAPVDLYTNLKWKNKLNKYPLSTTIHHSPQCINKINSINQSENIIIDYNKINYCSSSVPIIHDTSNYLIISNPFININNNNNLIYKTIETSCQQSFSNLLKPTNCQTEIKYDLNDPACIYKTIRTYYSYDSVMKNWIFQLTNLNTSTINNNNNNNNNNSISNNNSQDQDWQHTKLITTSPLHSNQLMTNEYSFNNSNNLQHSKYIQNYNKYKEDTTNNVKQNIIHCVNHNMLHNSNDNISISNSSNSNSSVITNSKTCTHSIIDSDSHGVGLTFSHVYCPLIYRESDFDVISVDENIEQDEPEPNSFL